MTKSLQKETLLSSYRNDVFKAAALEPLRMAGIAVDQGESSLHFSGELIATMGIFTCGAPVTAEHGAASVALARGDQVRCFMSRRFNDDEVKTVLGDVGWEVLSTSDDDARAHGVYLMRKTWVGGGSMGSALITAARVVLARYRARQDGNDQRVVTFPPGSLLELSRTVAAAAHPVMTPTGMA